MNKLISSRLQISNSKLTMKMKYNSILNSHCFPFNPLQILNQKLKKSGHSFHSFPLQTFHRFISSTTKINFTSNTATTAISTATNSVGKRTKNKFMDKPINFVLKKPSDGSFRIAKRVGRGANNKPTAGRGRKGWKVC